MKTTNLGPLTTSATGCGAMVLVDGMYGAADDERSLATLSHAIERGATLLDTADAYGPDGHNERLVGRAIAGRDDDVQVATKWGIVPGGENARRIGHLHQEIWVDAAGARPRRRRGEPAAPAGRRHRPLVPPFPDRPCRSRRPSPRWPSS